jgi:cullin 1
MSVVTRTVVMPPVPNREDLDATWRYLEAGVSKIMSNLQEGMDMTTVGSPSPFPYAR